MKTISTIALFFALVPACSKSPSSPPDAPGETPAPKPAEPASAPETAPEGSPDLAGLAGTYAVDPVHTMVVFRIKHFQVAYNYGQFTRSSGTIKLGGAASDLAVDIEVDANSVFTANKKRDDHLRSPDYFNTKQFPTIRFQSTRVKPLDAGRFEVTGDLSLHGVTKPVTTVFAYTGSGKSFLDESVFVVGFEGKLSIKRSDFGMDYAIGPVGDDVELTLGVEAIRQ